MANLLGQEFTRSRIHHFGWTWRPLARRTLSRLRDQ
jgi:hypothetical protein